MLLLTSTSDLLRLVTSSTANLQVHASWVDNTAGVITPGRTNTAISTATTTTVVGGPAASSQRAVKRLTVRNTHATDSNVVTVQHTDGTTPVELYEVTLAAGQSLVLDDDGFKRINARGDLVNGAPEAQKFSASTGSRGVLVAATASPGTLIHTNEAKDEVWLYATNTSAAAVLLTVEWGGTGASDAIIMEIPGKDGLTVVIPGMVLTGASAEVRAYAGTTNVIVVHGQVNRAS